MSDPILRTSEVLRRISDPSPSRTTLWRWIRQGHFPPPDVKLGPRMNGWYQSTVDGVFERPRGAA